MREWVSHWLESDGGVWLTLLWSSNWVLVHPRALLSSLNQTWNGTKIHHKLDKSSSLCSATNCLVCCMNFDSSGLYFLGWAVFLRGSHYWFYLAYGPGGVYTTWKYNVFFYQNPFEIGKRVWLFNRDIGVLYAASKINNFNKSRVNCKIQIP